jgi:hypothetical protein
MDNILVWTCYHISLNGLHVNTETGGDGKEQPAVRSVLS